MKREEAGEASEAPRSGDRSGAISSFGSDPCPPVTPEGLPVLEYRTVIGGN